MAAPPAAYAIKGAPDDPGTDRLTFTAAKTMYGGKRITADDPIYLFEGSAGLYARGRVIKAQPLPCRPDLARQTPRVTIEVEILARPQRPLGRAQLRAFDQWGDGRPQTELNFKYYRQATDKIVGLSPATAAFLDTLF